jgi:hypothetical protein
MSELLVCDTWPLVVQDGEGGYYHYVNARAGEVGRNAHCIRWLLHELALPLETVVEPFGGVGVFATVVQGALAPRTHRLYDIDPDCLRQLRQAFAATPGAWVVQADADEVIGSMSADLYLLDFPKFTVTDHVQWRTQLDRLFERKPKAVVWMDGASFGMQWHAARYGERFGEPVTGNADYARAMSTHIYRRYGYSLRAATVSRGCFYMAFTPDAPTDFPLCKFTTKGRALRPVGTRLVKADPPVLQRVTMQPAEVH